MALNFPFKISCEWLEPIDNGFIYLSTNKKKYWFDNFSKKTTELNSTDNEFDSLLHVGIGAEPKSVIIGDCDLCLRSWEDVNVLDAEYVRGTMVYALEADHEMNYFIVNKATLLPRQGYTEANIHIVGNLSKVGILNCDIQEGSRVTIVSDTPPEIVILGCTLPSNDWLEVIDSNGNPLKCDRVLINDQRLSEDDLETMNEYIKNKEFSVFDKESSSTGILATAIACLAVAGLTSLTKTKVKKEEEKTHVNNSQYAIAR